MFYGKIYILIEINASNRLFILVLELHMFYLQSGY